jgi:hypothetical protein
LAGLFVILGLAYDTLTPIFENSDETLHYPYVKHLADGRGLPVAAPGQPWNQEGTQPPLYYALAAAGTFWIDSDNLLEHSQPNPHWLFTDLRVLINDNQNLVLHGPSDTFPYRRAALAIHIGRWISIFFGLLTVLCTFLLARSLFPHSLPLVMTATALTALNPQFIRVSATVSNDSLAAALATLTVLLALKFAHSSVYSFAYGLLLGLALLTKLSSLTALVVVGVVIWGWGKGSRRERLGRLMLVGIVTGLVSGWWFVRNYQLYGEWLATETHLNLAGRAPLSFGELYALRAEAERAYWATFGWGQIRPPEWVYTLLAWFSHIGLLGLLVAGLGRFSGNLSSRPGRGAGGEKEKDVLILLLWAGLNLVLYVRWVMEVGSVSHTRLLFPAIAAISLLLALGWHALLPPRLAGWFSGAVVVCLLSLNLYSLGWLIGPAFTPHKEGISTGAQQAELHLKFLEQMELMGGAVNPRQAKAGDVVMVSVWWRVLAAPDQNYSVAIVLHAPDGTVLGRRETYPGLGLRPTRYLRPGEMFRDDYPLRVEQNVSEPLVAQVTVHLFDMAAQERAGLPAIDAAGNEVTPFVGQLKVVPHKWPTYDPPHKDRVLFGEAIALMGYEWTNESVGDMTKGDIELTLYWESLAPVDTDYVLFVHILEADSSLIAQADGPPSYPTSWWAAGETIADRRILPVGEGVVRVRLGFYHPVSGERLPITGTTLPLHDNSVELLLP